ncbi:sulfotransferase family 2 domain-containing protein [Candidatus Leptofilum sp.]|uniref:sulfotransferase family 2 domain-containing protein n=1 Tax=Candidatus Leptofilum sp. TaxID=3241576 RepID=UPI003B59FE0D
MSSNMSTNSQQTAIFLHIHKTAGTTLHAILRRQYAAAEVYNIDAKGHNFDHFRQLKQTQFANIRLLKGHMDYGLHEFLPQPAVYFTFLREPIERVISYYAFIQRTPQHPHHQAANELSLYEFANQQIDPLMANGQTRQLTGGYPQYEFGDEADTLLAKAKRHLQNHFVIVGLTEQFDESLILLQKTFSWQNVWYQRQNVGSNRPKKSRINEEVLALLTEQNQADKELYAYGRSLFQAQIAQQGALFPYRVQLFRWLNRFTKPYWQLRKFSVRAWLSKPQTS